MIQSPVGAHLSSLIHFGVGKAFILPFVPAQPTKSAHCRGDLVLRIQAKTILDAALLPVGRDVRLPVGSRKETPLPPPCNCPYSRD